MIYLTWDNGIDGGWWVWSERPDFERCDNEWRSNMGPLTQVKQPRGLAKPKVPTLWKINLGAAVKVKEVNP